MLATCQHSRSIVGDPQSPQGKPARLDAAPPFAFAGLWRQFRGTYRDELVELDTFTMLTTTPNALVREIHPDRMPVILDPADYEGWLTGGADRAAELLRPFDEARMRVVVAGEDVKGDEGGNVG
ncbi:MAG: SOS response-associated peptidase family protein [Pseudomonadota bacterium]